MKIVFSSNGRDLDSKLDLRFGRCEYFHIYDTENNNFRVVENTGNTAKGGAGIAAANQLLDEKIDVVVTGQLGPNAFEIIEDAKIKMYKCESISIQLVLEKYNQGQLEEIKASKSM